MCGIAGKIYFNNQRINKAKELPLIKATLQKLHHRGPDDSGSFIDGQVWLAASRLAIIDLSPFGHQPFVNEDKTVSLAFNGEIYNYGDLLKKLKKRHKFISHTDAEVVLHLYEEDGTDCLKYLRGMFAFAIWDSKKQQLFIARDRIGKKPLKYYFKDSFFVFASELKAFLHHPGVPKIPDWEAIDQFLSYQYVPPPKTGFKNICKLPPAHYMIVKPDGNLVIKQYWNLNFSKKLDYSESGWSKLLTSELKRSVELRLQSDVPLGIHLSGGLDSSIITALACSVSKKRIKTFSIGFSNSQSDELPFSKITAEKFHTDHHEFRCDPSDFSLLPQIIHQFEEPFADPSIIPTWVLMEETKKYVTVVLNGDGGDENFAGYRRYVAMKLMKLLTPLPFPDYFNSLFSSFYQRTHRRIFSTISKYFALTDKNYRNYYKNLVSFLPCSLKNTLYTEEFKMKLTHCASSDHIDKRFAEIKESDLIDQLLYVDVKTYLPEVLLAKSDICSMAYSIETRSPFLDHVFMEFIAKIPSNLKLKNFTGKYILKKAFSGTIPQKVIQRSKRGFTPPLEDWFRDNLKVYIRTQLLDRNFLELGIFTKVGIEHILDEHQSWRANNGYMLWTLLCLKQWFDVWFSK